MKAVILAGGLGTRISEESHLKPKPMIEIGGKPILWHIMKSYTAYGVNDFIICCGYKQHAIKEYFADYYLRNSDVTFDFKNGNKMRMLTNTTEAWRVTIVDTGFNTMTGGRLKRIKQYVGNETFMLTYGDGVCDINVNSLLTFHRAHSKIATITAIQPGGKFGALEIEPDGAISNFTEKRKGDVGWINGGFMIFEPEIFEYLRDDETVLERDPLEKLAAVGQLSAYRHHGFWQCMDTLRDKMFLEELIVMGKAPWITWEVS